MKGKGSIFMLLFLWLLPRLNCMPGISITMWVAGAPGSTKDREKHPVKFGLGKQMRKFHQKPCLVSMDFTFLCRAFTLLKATEPSSAGVLDIIFKEHSSYFKILPALSSHMWKTWFVSTMPEMRPSHGGCPWRG